MAEGGKGDDRNWSMWLRLLSHSVRDTTGSAAADETTVLQAVKNLQQLCSKGEHNGDLVARVYPHLAKIFSRCSGSSSTQKTSTGLLVLALLALMDEAYTGSIIADIKVMLRMVFVEIRGMKLKPYLQIYLRTRTKA